MRVHRFAAGMLCLVLLAARGNAQQTESNLRVTVQAADGAPIGGALIELVDASGRVVTQGLSATNGYRVLRATNGDYRIRIKRIGFEPSLTETIPLTGDLDRTVVVSDRRVVLSTVVVSSKSQCKLGENQGVDLVWEEISKALLGTSLNRVDLKDLAGWRKFTHRLSLTGKRLSADTTPVAPSTGRPFGAINPKTLREAGYVTGNVQFGWTFYGVDETVLLSPEFLETHCFKLVRTKDRPNEVGMRFDPIPSRRLSDVTGTLWLDEITSELREIDFRYVNVEGISKLKAGGEVHFRRMPSGAWIVDSWALRFPTFEKRKGFAGDYVAETGYLETGGFVASIR